MPIQIRKPRRSECPISCTLDILGDKWTLLVLRDLLDGKRRFGEFERAPEGIPTNILSERLRRLVDVGLVTRDRSEVTGRPEYRATDAGLELRPVLLALAAWGNRHVDNTWTPPADYLTDG